MATQAFSATEERGTPTRFQVGGRTNQEKRPRRDEGQKGCSLRAATAASHTRNFSRAAP